MGRLHVLLFAVALALASALKPKLRLAPPIFKIDVSFYVESHQNNSFDHIMAATKFVLDFSIYVPLGPSPHDVRLAFGVDLCYGCTKLVLPFEESSSRESWYRAMREYQQRVYRTFSSSCRPGCTRHLVENDHQRSLNIMADTVRDLHRGRQHGVPQVLVVFTDAPKENLKRLKSERLLDLDLHLYVIGLTRTNEAGPKNSHLIHRSTNAKLVEEDKAMGRLAKTLARLWEESEVWWFVKPEQPDLPRLSLDHYFVVDHKKCLEASQFVKDLRFKGTLFTPMLIHSYDRCKPVVGDIHQVAFLTSNMTGESAVVECFRLDETEPDFRANCAVAKRFSLVTVPRPEGTGENINKLHQCQYEREFIFYGGEKGREKLLEDWENHMILCRPMVLLCTF